MTTINKTQTRRDYLGSFSADELARATAWAQTAHGRATLLSYQIPVGALRKSVVCFERRS